MTKNTDRSEPCPNTTSEFIVPGPIDWAALAQQKRWLLSQAETSEEAAGLVELLDAIQDAAVDRAGFPQATVFPNLDESEEQVGNLHRNHGQ